MAAGRRSYEGALAKFAQMEAEGEPYEFELDGKTIPVLPGVFSPKYFSDVDWFAREVPRLVGNRSLLEIGTGTGIIALFVALVGSGRILATDVNPRAVKNAEETFRRHGIRAAVRESDVFSAIAREEQFDVIFWNHPFFCATEPVPTMLARGGFDYHYESLRAFFAGAKTHLNPGGEVLLGTSKTANLGEILRMARTYGYRARLVKKAQIPSRRRPGVFMDARIYSFRPKVS